MKMFFVGLLLIGSTALADIHDMNVMIKKASPEETKDLGQLLKSLSVMPTKDKHNGKLVFKVKKVEKGSFWEKQGVKIGDLFTQ